MEQEPSLPIMRGMKLDLQHCKVCLVSLVLWSDSSTLHTASDAAQVLQTSSSYFPGAFSIWENVYQTLKFGAVIVLMSCSGNKNLSVDLELVEIQWNEPHLPFSGVVGFWMCSFWLGALMWELLLCGLQRLTQIVSHYPLSQLNSSPNFICLSFIFNYTCVNILM